MSAAIWRRADLVTPDSTGVLWAARRSGFPLAERVSGVELAEELCQHGQERFVRWLLPVIEKELGAVVVSLREAL